MKLAPSPGLLSAHSPRSLASGSCASTIPLRSVRTSWGARFKDAARSAGYRDYLRLTYSFVVPSERAILATPDIERHVDVRRFRKADLLRRDLTALRIIDELPMCSVPIFELPEQALGWAYLLERSTLQHAALFRHIASTIPGEVAFASSYLKCRVGRVGDSRRHAGAAHDPGDRPRE